MLNIKPIGETILPNNNLINIISNTKTLEYKKQLLPKLIITSQSKNKILTIPTTRNETDNQLILQVTIDLINILNSNGQYKFCKFNITVTTFLLNKLSQDNTNELVNLTITELNAETLNLEQLELYVDNSK